MKIGPEGWFFKLSFKNNCPLNAFGINAEETDMALRIQPHTLHE